MWGRCGGKLWGKMVFILWGIVLYCGGLFYTVGEVLGEVGVGRRGWGRKILAKATLLLMVPKC